MKEKTLEQISALVDGEFEPYELDRLTDQLTESDELRRVWNRYQLRGDPIRGETVDPRLFGVADWVRARLAEEPTVLAPAAGRAVGATAPWLKPVAGTAIAASVAAAVVLLAPETIDREAPAGSRVVDMRTDEGALTRERGYTSPSGTRWALGKPDVESKLNSYLVNHHKYAPSANMQGMLPYASFVAYDVER